jgi:hypothetical protein
VESILYFYGQTVKAKPGVMMVKYHGPFTIPVDDDQKTTTVTLKLSGLERWRLLHTEIERLRLKVLKRAAEIGYTVVEV